MIAEGDGATGGVKRRRRLQRPIEGLVQLRQLIVALPDLERGLERNIVASVLARDRFRASATCSDCPHPRREFAPLKPVARIVSQ